MIVLMRVDYTRYNSPRFIYPALSVTTCLLVMVFFFRELAQHPSLDPLRRLLHLSAL